MNAAARNPQAAPRARGFTLIEAVMALSIISLVVGGATAAILLVARAAPAGQLRAAEQMRTATFAEQFTADLRYATAFIDRDDHHVEFTVADRTGNGEPERIRYEWSGTEGDPVFRSLNGGTSRPVLDDTRRFWLAFWTTDDPQDPTRTLVVSAAMYVHAGSDSAGWWLGKFPILGAVGQQP